MKTILVPVDFSFHSTKAARYAVHMAKDLEMEVHLLHVSRLPVPPISTPVYGSTSPMAGMEPVIREIRHEATESMRNLMQDIQKDVHQAKFNGPVHQTVLEGDPVEEIRAWIKEHNPACLVMGVTPRSSLYRMFIGSVAGKLLQCVELPIIAVPTGAEYQGVDKVVFASDFDPEDLSLFTRMNETLGHQIRDWYVVHMVSDLEEEYFHDKEDDLRRIMEERWRELSPGSSLHTEILSEGALLDAVEKFAVEHQAGLVAFVMHRRNAIGRLLDPSVSAEALFHLHVPMLFLHTEAVSGAIW